MSKLHIKKGDQVVVLAGKCKGKTGVILSVDVKNQRAVVEGLNMVKKSTKPSAANPQGGFVEVEAPIHISNLAHIAEMTKDANGNPKAIPTRIGRRMGENGKLVRYAKKTGKEI